MCACRHIQTHAASASTLAQVMEDPYGCDSSPMDDPMEVDDEDLSKYLLQTAETQDPTAMQQPSPPRVPSTSMNASPQKSNPGRVPSTSVNASPQKSNPGTSPQKSIQDFFKTNPSPQKPSEPGAGSLQTPPKPTSAANPSSLNKALSKAG